MALTDDGDGIVLAIFAFAGRIIFRLRLFPVSRNEGPLMSSGLDRKRGNTRN
jgi:hypothetical protein